MSDLRARMIEDRTLRDAARALIEADIENVRGDFSSKGLASRAKDRLSEGAIDVYEEATSVASDNKGALAAIVAALILWFARNPITDLLFNEARDESTDTDSIADVTHATHDEMKTNTIHTGEMGADLSDHKTGATQ